MAAPSTKKLKAALLSGNGAATAEALKRFLTVRVNVQDLTKCLEDTVACLQHELQTRKELEAGVPSGKPLHLKGFDFDSGIATELQNAMIQQLDAQSKGRLACVSKYWHNAVTHPAFWKKLNLRITVDIPLVKEVTTFLNARAQQFSGVKTLVWPYEYKGNWSSLQYALQICSKTERLVVKWTYLHHFRSDFPTISTISERCCNQILYTLQNYFQTNPESKLNYVTNEIRFNVVTIRTNMNLISWRQEDDLTRWRHEHGCGPSREVTVVPSFAL
jgi:hypothetical protein